MGKPTISDLAKQLSGLKCNHLMGREVIEKSIVDLAMAKISKDYCQNWDRCTDNGWSKCTPDKTKWIERLSREEYRNVFTPEELKIIAGLKIQRG